MGSCKFGANFVWGGVAAVRPLSARLDMSLYSTFAVCNPFLFVFVNCPHIEMKTKQNKFQNNFVSASFQCADSFILCARELSAPPTGGRCSPLKLFDTPPILAPTGQF